MLTQREEPLLRPRRHGLGRTAVFASNAKDFWAPPGSRCAATVFLDARLPFRAQLAHVAAVAQARPSAILTASPPAPCGRCPLANRRPSESTPDRPCLTAGSDTQHHLHSSQNGCSRSAHLRQVESFVCALGAISSRGATLPLAPTDETLLRLSCLHDDADGEGAIDRGIPR